MELEEKLKFFKNDGYKYNPETGIVTNKYNKEIKNIHGGYYRLATSIKKTLYQVNLHQYAWYYIYNEVPIMIDHINMNKLDNRLCNLRLTTQQKNQFNRNVNGYEVINRIKCTKYLAIINLNKKKIKIGYYTTPEDAHDAYLNAKKIYHII